MRTFLFLAAIFAFIITSPTAFGQSSDKGEVQKARIKTDTLEFTVYGMDCPGCEGGLEKQVNKIKSVETSEANWRKQKLQIVLKTEANLDIKALEKRVKKANFTLDKKALKEDE